MWSFRLFRAASREVFSCLICLTAVCAVVSARAQTSSPWTFVDGGSFPVSLRLDDEAGTVVAGVPVLESGGADAVTFNVLVWRAAVESEQPAFALARVSGTPSAVDGSTLSLTDISVTNVQVGADSGFSPDALRGGLNRLFSAGNVRVPGGPLLGILNNPASAGAISAGSVTSRIVYRDRPVEVVLFDGQPSFEAEGEGGLKVARNGSHELWFDPYEGRYWIRSTQGQWMHAYAFAGPFVPSADPPARIKRAAGRVRPDALHAPFRGSEPNARSVLVSTQPVTLLTTTGPVEWQRLNDQWEHAANANRPLFRWSEDGSLRLLTSGRVYQSEGLSGPWRVLRVPDPPMVELRTPALVAQHLFGVDRAGNHVDRRVLQLPNSQVPQGLPDQFLRMPFQIAGAPETGESDRSGYRRLLNATTWVITDSLNWYAVVGNAWYQADRLEDSSWTLMNRAPNRVYVLSTSDALYPLKHVYPVYDPVAEAVAQQQLRQREEERRRAEEEWRWRHRYDPWDDPWYWHRRHDPWYWNDWHYRDPWWPHRPWHSSWPGYPWHGYHGPHAPGFSIGISAREWYEINDDVSIGIGTGVWHHFD